MKLNIAKILKEAKMTQYRFGKEVGTGQVWRWVNGITSPGDLMTDKLERYFRESNIRVFYVKPE